MSVYGEERYAEHHDVAHLERRIDELRQNLTALAEGQDLAELIRQIRKPGYTTPAEFTLVLGIVEGLNVQTRALAELKRTLLVGSEKVALNPQPLPPKE